MRDLFGGIKRLLVRKNHFGGGANLSDAQIGARERGSLAQIISDLATDILGVQLPTVAASAVSTVAAMTSADAAGGDSPTEAEHNALRADVVALRARMVEARTLINELRTAIIAHGGTPTVTTVLSNAAESYDLSDGDYTLTFELANEPLTLHVLEATISSLATNTAAVTADEMVAILLASQLERMGVVPSESGGSVLLTTVRKGAGITLDTFAGSLEDVLDFSAGTTVAGVGYQPLVYTE